MTEEELIDDFTKKVSRYLSEPDGGIFAPAAKDYFDAAQNLGASLLLKMVDAYQERPNFLKTIDNLKSQLEAKSHELTAESVLLERVEAEAQRRAPQLRNQVREMASQIEAAIAERTTMEYAGAQAIAALRGVADNEALTADQHAEVAAAILAMLDAKPRWQNKEATTT
jgi:hypothetical protein